MGVNYCACLYAFVVASCLLAEVAQAQKFVYNDPVAVPSIVLAGVVRGGVKTLYKRITLAHTTGPARIIRPRKPDLNRLHIANDVWIRRREPDFVTYVKVLNHPCAEFQEPFLDCASRYTQLTIDASSYIMYPKTAYILSTVSPRTKVIMMFRDPVSRSESMYCVRKNAAAEDMAPSMEINKIAEEFLAWTQMAGPSSWITRMMQATTPHEMEMFYEELIVAGLLTDGFELFGSGLYYYPLMSWYHTLLIPSRTLIIDSHAYFADHMGVMEQVNQFLYGRNLSKAERNLLTGFKPLHVEGEDDIQPECRLSSSIRDQLTAFYQPHQQRFLALMQQLKEENFWVHGFNSTQWTY